MAELDEVCMREVCKMCFNSTNHKPNPTLTPESKATFDISTKTKKCSVCHQEWAPIKVTKEIDQGVRSQRWVRIRPKPKIRAYQYQLCKRMQNTGTCWYGQQCNFAHSKEELRSWLSVKAATKVPSTKAVMEETQVGLKFQCDVCNLLCTSKRQLDDHISQSGHQQQVAAHALQVCNNPTPAQSTGRTASIRRRPLLSVPLSGYELCPHIEAGRQCPYGDYCTFAHSQVELEKWNSQLQIVNTPHFSRDSEMFQGGGLPPYPPPMGLMDTMPGDGLMDVGVGGAPMSSVLGEALQPVTYDVSGLGYEMTQGSQDFAFLLRARITSQHKQKQDVQGFEEVHDHVTISEISGQDLSLTLSQTAEISWIFEVSVTAPQILNAIVLFDPLTADFNIDSVLMVMYGGRQRPLSGTRALQGVGIQIYQKISRSDQIHVKLTVIPRLGILGQLVLFDFGPFHMVRGLTVHVLNDQEARLLQISQSTRAKKPQKRDLYWEQHYTPIPMTTPYVEKTDHLLPEYLLPENVERLIESGRYSNVEDRVTKVNYRLKMHNLLYLEEYQQRVDMSRYDLYDVEIAPSREYQTVDMGMLYAPPGYYYIKVTLDELLFEGRRSVRTNDWALLLPLYQHMVHECHVEHVGRESIILKITEKAQQASASNLNRCCIRFLQSRVLMQSMHYAVDHLDLATIFPSSQTTGTNSETLPSIKRCLESLKSSNLNKSQQDAITSMLDPAYRQIPSLVLGPFGCGKTHTLRECVKLLAVFAPDMRILICTHTNSAADLYVEELHAEWKRHGYERAPLFRLYFTGRKLTILSPTVKEYCKFEEGQLAIPSLQELRQHQIIVTTLSTSRALALMGMPKGHFSHIFIDEAAQALEAETLIPLTIANERTKIVLAGDHMQMEPPVYSDLARQYGLHVSLLVRLYDHEAYDSCVGQQCKTLLTENRRTHQQILDLPSKLFYKNKLTCRAVFPMTGPKDIPAIKFIGVDGHEAQEEDSPSYYNNHESIQIAEQVQMLVSRGLQPEDICVLAYYSKQVMLIMNLLRKKRLSRVTVYRIDDVLAKEFRALLISTVRTCSTEQPNSKEEVEFLTSLKLFNTAITQAREWLIVVGEPITLCTVGSNRLCWLEFIRRCYQLGTFEYPNADHFETFLETKLITRQILEKTHENFFRNIGSASNHILQVQSLKSQTSDATQSGNDLTISKITADSHQKELSKATAFAVENQQAINDKFAVFLTNVCNKMLKNGVNIETFRLFVVALFPPGDCIPPLPTNLAKIFEAITHHGLWDSLHYSPLVQIIRKFGAGDPEMEAWIQNYKKDVKAYAIVATVEDCSDDTCTDQSLLDIAKYDPRYNCPVEWKTDFVNRSLQHLTDVWEIFSDQYLVPDSPPTTLLDRVQNGGMSVTWLVPSYLIPQLVKTAKVDTTFFQKHRILDVTIGDEVVYEEEVAEESIEEHQLAHQNGTQISRVTMGHEGSVEVGQFHEKFKAPAQKESFGGYECEFVERPPSPFQTKCLVCHLILREPYLVSCCGNSFCHTCIQRLQANDSHCPTCREDNFEVFPNKGLERSLKQLQVYCTHRKHGCQWRAELGELDQHLDESKECPLIAVEKENEKEADDGLGKRQSAFQKEELGYMSKQKQEASELQPYGSPMLELVDRDGKTIDWSDMGIFLSVPANATSTSVRIRVQTFLPGPHSVILPENTELVSPIYKVDISPDLTKEAEFSVAHFAALHSEVDCLDMDFLHSTDKSPPYHFSPVPGGKFVPHGALGTITIGTFSKWAIWRRKRTANQDNAQLKYVVHLYRPLKQHRHAVFSASLYQASYTKNIQDELAASFPDIRFWHTSRPVDLAGDVLNLIIPNQSVKEQGYSISTDQDCQIFREILDLPSHQPECDSSVYPPRLLLTVRALDESHPPTTDLICDLEVKGTVRQCCLRLEMNYSSQDAKSEKSSRASSVHSKGKPTLRELSTHVIAEVASKWHSLGIELGLPADLLRCIEQNHSKDSQRCCEEVFKEWLVRPDLEPSWSSLIEALNAVSRRDMAYELKQLFSL